MKNNLKSSFWKFILLCLFAIMLVGVVKILAIKKYNSYQNLLKFTEYQKHFPKVYFVGSSRVQRGVNPFLLQKIAPKHDFYNVGLSGASILYNCLLAEKIVRIAPKNSIIYIELTDLLILLPNQSNYFYSFKDYLLVLKKHFQLRFSFAELDTFFYGFFTIRTEIKSLFYSEKLILNEIGYSEKDVFFQGDASSIITKNDLGKADSSLTEMQEKYFEILEELIKKGNKKQILIKFILPVTIAKPSERKQTLAIYNKISEENKLIYADDFLIKIHQKNYLNDPNHLNSKGAYLNTLEIWKDIKKSRE